MVAACATGRGSGAASAPVTTVDVASSSSAAAAIQPPRSQEVSPLGATPPASGDLGPLPVTAADPASGRSDALVTLVVFADFQCPFCSRSARTLGELRQRYPDADLRIVWKNQPLPFHQRAMPAAEAAQAVFEARGAEAFWRFHDALFADQRALEDADLERVASDVGVSPSELGRFLARGSAGQKVRSDMELAKAVGATGTPTFFANGTELGGAQPLEKFVSLVDAELARARAALAQGVRRDAIYATLTKTNLAASLEAHRKEREDRASPPPEDSSPLVVSIAGAPVRGPSTALVTIVEFSDFQCPFCARVQPTLLDVQKRFGNKVRIVWRNQPLSFHPRAEPMAEAAHEAFVQRGNDGFWKLHDAFFKENGASLPQTDEDLVKLTTKAGFGAAKMRDAIRTKKHHATIERDIASAKKVGANGTPTFFINGRKLTGAQPLEKFETVINEELVKAEALVARGVPRQAVYDELQKTAKPAAP